MNPLEKFDTVVGGGGGGADVVGGTGVVSI